MRGSLRINQDVLIASRYFNLRPTIRLELHESFNEFALADKIHRQLWNVIRLQIFVNVLGATNLSATIFNAVAVV